jgi:phosphatidylglycerol:prolipoprotein diacylglycerol transferase
MIMWYNVVAATQPIQDAIQRLAGWTILFRRGEYLFVTFGLFAGLAALAGSVWAGWLLLAQGVPFVEAAALLAGCLTGHLVVARAFLLPWSLASLRSRPLSTLRTVEFASWGGFAAIAFAVGLYAWLSDRPMLDLTDVTVRSGTLGHAIGRLGCISFGCCFGRPTKVSFAVCYHNSQAKAVRGAGLQGVPLLPVPLYESVFLLALFGLLNGIAFAGAAQGLPTAVYLILYGSARLFLETLRYDDGGDKLGPLPRNYWLSLITLASGAGLLAALMPFDGPSQPSLAADWIETLALLPILAASSAVVFLAYSVHRGSLGRW